MSDLQPSPNAEGNSSNSAQDVVISTDNSTITGHILPDGRVNIHLINQKASKSTKRFKASRRRDVQLQQGEDLTRNNREYETDFQSILSKYFGLPRLNIAIHIVGSRGDVQPFISIGQILSKPPYSHRVRICTHPVFKDFVEENDLEFFSIGGDPATLMSYMVKNPGLLPGKESWKAGDVTNRRADIAEILEGCWKSCIEPGNGMGGEREGAEANIDDGAEEADRLFIADAIIANPPSYGHIHCAEKLAIPLHIMFTMPWSPTQYFPHPLATMTNNHSDPKISNYISYGVMEMLSWQGLGDVINGFRMKTLNLDAVSPLWGHMLLSRMKVPFTYLWSSALIPKPPDWGPHIDIAGFSFLSAPLTYQPPDDLVNFLKAGPPPVYIGFGSIVVDNPDQLTETIFKAVKRAGVRALVSKGWGGIGGEEPPNDVFLLGNCPHDWLFNFVSCVVHHGGAGTTATGVATGKPTVVIPFFGDQPFWGQMIYNSGAGPPPVSYKHLTEERLAESILIALGPEVQKGVKILSEKISNENGASTAAASFQSKLQPVNADSMRCFISPEYLAVWRVKKTNVRLCSLAAATLIENGLLDLDQIKLFRHRDWYTDEGARDPIVGLIASVSGIMTDAIVNTRKYSKNIWKMIHQKPEKMNSELTNPGTDSELGLSEEMKNFQSQNPESTTVAYPPHHLEMVAHEVAAKTLVDKKERSKHRRVNSWSPNQRATGNSQKSQQQHQQSSRFHDVAVETGHYALFVIRTGCNAPVSFFYNVANGFHNAPSFMLHDDTVRERDNITGFGSGMKVAGKGFIFNIFDGVTGVVTQPYFGARKEGTLGFVKGIGKGVGGLVFKPVAAVIGIPGYTFKGIQKQFENRRDRALKAKIFEARMRQGSAAYARATAEERKQILSRWKELGYNNLST